MVSPEAVSQPVEHKETRAEKEYADFLYMTLGPLSLFIAMIVCALVLRVQVDVSDPNSLPCLMALTDDEVLTMVPPASRLFDKAKLSPRVRQMVTSSGDGLGLGLAVAAYIARIFSLAQQTQEGRQQNAQQTQGIPTGSNASNGYYTEQSVAGLAGFGAFVTG